MDWTSVGNHNGGEGKGSENEKEKTGVDPSETIHCTEWIPIPRQGHHGLQAVYQEWDAQPQIKVVHIF